MQFVDFFMPNCKICLNGLFFALDLLSGDEIWKNVFSVEAFSGVHILDYFRDGSTIPASPSGTVQTDKIYRHESMTEKLEKAKFIRFSVYDLDMNRVKYLIFQPLGEDDFESWFTWERIYYNWGWNFEGRSVGSWGHSFDIWDTVNGDSISQSVRFFTILDRFASCSGDIGWLMALNYIEPAYMIKSCTYEKWWLRADFTNEEITDRNQPPAFLYSDTPGAKRYLDQKPGGKITIDSFRAKLFSTF